MTTQQINHVCILDRTHASPFEPNRLVEAYYESIDHIRMLVRMNPHQDHRITLVTLQNKTVHVAFFGMSVMDDRVYNRIDSVNAGGAPLFDAVAQTVGMLRVADRLTTIDKAFRFTLFTNGRDTGSVKYNATATKMLIESLYSPKWSFTIVGNSSYTASYAELMGIRQVCVLNNKQRNSKLALHLSHLIKQGQFEIKAA